MDRSVFSRIPCLDTSLKFLADFPRSVEPASSSQGVVAERLSRIEA